MRKHENAEWDFGPLISPSFRASAPRSVAFYGKSETDLRLSNVMRRY